MDKALSYMKWLPEQAKVKTSGDVEGQQPEESEITMSEYSGNLSCVHSFAC